jgi:hypothetical protein
VRPFFPFYGSKWRSAKLFDAPTANLVIEPFAGSAGYATFYEPGAVMLMDRDPIIVGVWEYLIRESAGAIRRLPEIEPGEDVQTFDHLPQEARWLIGFWLNRGSAMPKRKRTAYSARTERAQLVWSERARERIASQVDRIRHWTVFERDVLGFAWPPTPQATWFIDPPYEDKGRYYRFSSVDYAALGSWCREREGQVIVCENVGAEWLPFERLATIKSTRGVSVEAIWMNARPKPAQLQLVIA